MKKTQNIKLLKMSGEKKSTENEAKNIFNIRQRTGTKFSRHCAHMYVHESKTSVHFPNVKSFSKEHIVKDS